MISKTKIVIHPEKDNICYGEVNINVELLDEAAGYFISITDNSALSNEIRLDISEVDECIKALRYLKALAIKSSKVSEDK